MKASTFAQVVVVVVSAPAVALAWCAWRPSALENPLWIPIREYEEALSLRASAYDIPLSIGLAERWENVSAEQRRLFSLAESIDQEGDSLTRRAEALDAEAYGSLIPEHARVDGSDDAVAVRRYSARALAWQARQTQLVKECAAFDERVSRGYSQPLTAWEAQLSEFARLQRNEADRLDGQIATRYPDKKAAPIPEPTPRIDARALPRLMLEPLKLPARALYDTSLYAGLHPEETGKAAVVGLEVGAALAGLELPVAPILVAKILHGTVEAAEQVEVDRQRQEEESQRRIPLLARRLAAFNRSEDDAVRKGDRTEAEAKTRKEEFGRTLEANLARERPAQDNNLRRDIFSERSGWAVVSTVGSWATSKVGGKVAASELEDASEQLARFLHASKDQTLKPTTELFKSAVGAATEYAIPKSSAKRASGFRR